MKTGKYKVQYSSWHTGGWYHEQARVTDWNRERRGDGRAEGSAAAGDGGPAATAPTPDADGTGSGSC